MGGDVNVLSFAARNYRLRLDKSNVGHVKREASEIFSHAGANWTQTAFLGAPKPDDFLYAPLGWLKEHGLDLLR